MRTTGLSTPLCQNCCMTELYCQAVRELDQRPCCSACEHVDLPDPSLAPSPTET